VGDTYSVSNAPYVIWRVLNPDGAADTNRLWIIENRSSLAITNQYAYAPTNVLWTFVSGNGLRTETKQVQWDGAARIRTEIWKVYSGTGTNQLAFQEVNEYKVFSFGLALSERRVGAPGSEITATNTYYTIGNGAGQLDTVTRSDGSWESYAYDAQGRVSIKYFSSFTNQTPVQSQSLSRSSQYLYAPISGSGDDTSATNGEPRTTYEVLFGSHISRQYLVRRPDERIEAIGQKVSVSWNTAGNLFTTNRFYTNGAFAGYAKSTFRPDGTATVYFYETNSTLKTITVLDGQPDPANATNILDGAKTVTVVGLAGQTYSNTVYALPQTNVILSQEIYSDFDDLFRPRRITYLDGTYKQLSYDCCGLEYEIDRDGTRTDYGVDDLKRRTSVTRNGITTFYTYDGAGRVTSTSRQGTDASTMVLESSVYDTAGRLTARTNALNQPTLFSEFISSNQLVRVTTNPDGGTMTNFLARDGSLLEVGGTAAFPQRYQYGIPNIGGSETRLYTLRTRLDASGTNEWTRTYVSPIGVEYLKEFARANTPYPYEWTTNNLKGLITNHVDADGVITMFRHNANAEQEYTIVDSNRNYTIDYAGLDRITRTANDIVTNASGFVVRRTQTYLWSTNGSGVSNLVSSVEISTDGLRSWNTVWNNGSAITSHSRLVFDAANGYRYLTNIAPDNSYSVAITRYGTNVSVTAFDSLNNQLSAIHYGYDSHGRQNAVNLTNDGRWLFTSDAENRITSFTRISSAPLESKVKVDCQYDYHWRRTQKIVSAWNGSAYVAQSTNKFVYDGWNLIAILDSNSSLLYSFQWGTDASGSLQGAGGVGGLISMTVYQGTNAGTYFYCFDGNHNVAALVNATDGTVAAVYEYAGFGELLRATGPLAFINPFTFSTKFCDWETGFLYFGYLK